LLRDRVLTRIDEVWSSDITYVPMRHGFMDLTAVIDRPSRYVPSWRLSNTLDGGFCLEALDEALSRGRPETFITDQDLQAVVILMGWDATYSSGDTSITWSSPSDLLAISPGASAVFGFSSANPPAIGNYQATGFDPDLFQFYSNARTTSTPGAASAPEPSSLTLAGLGAMVLLGFGWASRKLPVG
jgi:hypothetical protein